MAEWVPNSLLLRENVEGPTKDCVARGQARRPYVKSSKGRGWTGSRTNKILTTDTFESTGWKVAPVSLPPLSLLSLIYLMWCMHVNAQVHMYAEARLVLEALSSITLYCLEMISHWTRSLPSGVGGLTSDLFITQCWGYGFTKPCPTFCMGAKYLNSGFQAYRTAFLSLTGPSP